MLSEYRPVVHILQTIWIEKLNCRWRQTRKTEHNVYYIINEKRKREWEKKASSRKPVVEKMKFLWEILVFAVIALFPGYSGGNKNYTTSRKCIYLLVYLRCILYLKMIVEHSSSQPMLCQLDVHYYGFSFYFAIQRYDFHRATYAFQSHQKIGLFFYIKLSYAFVMAFFPLFLLLRPVVSIVVTSVLRIPNSIKNIWTKQWRSTSAITT